MEKMSAFSGLRRAASVVLLVLVSASLHMLQPTDATNTKFDIVNPAAKTGVKGGKVFNKDVGKSFAKDSMGKAKAFILDTFKSSPELRVDVLTLSVEDMGDSSVAETGATSTPYHVTTHLSASYVENYSRGDTHALQIEMTGVIFHESTHVWQNDNGNYGTDPQFTGTIEGIADYVRLTAQLPARTWSKKAGGNWYDGYSTTAYFFDWIDTNVLKGFVDQLNKMMINKWEVSFFKKITGMDVNTLWQKYQKSL